MPIDFTPLRKVLELEHRKDYSDSVVFGGLDRFLAKWGARVEGAITDSALLKRFNKLRKINYRKLLPLIDGIILHGQYVYDQYDHPH